jgi:tRNA (guanine-N7-)-methyltransferase
MMDVLSSTETLHNLAGEGQFSARPESRPETKFERRGHRLGHGVWDLLFAKR